MCLADLLCKDRKTGYSTITASYGGEKNKHHTWELKCTIYLNVLNVLLGSKNEKKRIPIGKLTSLTSKVGCQFDSPKSPLLYYLG